MTQKDIKNFTLAELRTELVTLQEAPYRAKQIFSWLYKKGITDFNSMANLSQSFKDKLTAGYAICKLELAEHLKSNDLTEKFLFKLADGNFIESVLIRTGKRNTICISTQVGCKYNCPFCASGRMGFIRNLTTAEITSQIFFLKHNQNCNITNYVFMGMGEPLDNYDNLEKAIFIMNDPDGMAISARRITVSTSGVIPGMKKMQDLKLQINLSISLHAVNNSLRNELMPINKKYPIEDLIQAGIEYVTAKGRMITLEYVLIKDKNDSLADAEQLAQFAKQLKAKINIIPYSPIPGLTFQAPQTETIDSFINTIEDNWRHVTLRESKGADIQAACGQLAPKETSSPTGQAGNKKNKK